jgi:UDP-3-O-acyl N-acetylglucosamine deacetylase
MTQEPYEQQHTLRRSTRIEGVGLHTGRSARVEFKPSPPDSGITFIRTDLPGAPPVSALAANILHADRRPRRTSVGNGTVEVHTIEHLMASCFGLGLDNLLVEISAEEVPGLDGSSYPFLEVFKQAGIQEQQVPRRICQIREPVWVEEDDTCIMVLPDEKFRVTYTLSYPVSSLSAQFFSAAVTPGFFEKELAASRTFCLAEEVEALRRVGLGKGANYENTVVVESSGRVINNHLRYPDEFVRHKILDLIGDLALLGVPFIGHLIADRSGHALHTMLVEKVLEQTDKWILLGAKEEPLGAQSRSARGPYGHVQTAPLPVSSTL